MKTELWLIGKTSFGWLEEGLLLYEKRLSHYVSFQSVVLPEVKYAGSLPIEKLKQKEAELVLKKLQETDWLIILDERGKSFSSSKFAEFLEKNMIEGRKRLIFLVGGAFGFHASIYERANFQISLSSMTFSHQMVRLFFIEQLYRAMTIIRGESYHNE